MWREKKMSISAHSLCARHYPGTFQEGRGSGTEPAPVCILAHGHLAELCDLSVPPSEVITEPTHRTSGG